MNGIWEGPPWHPPQSTSPSSTIHTPPRCLWDSGWVVSRETCEAGELAEQSMAVPGAGLNPQVSLPTSHPGFPPTPPVPRAGLGGLPGRVTQTLIPETLVTVPLAQSGLAVPTHYPVEAPGSHLNANHMAPAPITQWPHLVTSPRSSFSVSCLLGLLVYW